MDLNHTLIYVIESETITFKSRITFTCATTISFGTVAIIFFTITMGTRITTTNIRTRSIKFDMKLETMKLEKSGWSWIDRDGVRKWLMNSKKNRILERINAVRRVIGIWKFIFMLQKYCRHIKIINPGDSVKQTSIEDLLYVNICESLKLGVSTNLTSPTEIPSSKPVSKTYCTSIAARAWNLGSQL